MARKNAGEARGSPTTAVKWSAFASEVGNLATGRKWDGGRLNAMHDAVKARGSCESVPITNKRNE